jgi:hypothetical protein
MQNHLHKNRLIVPMLWGVLASPVSAVVISQYQPGLASGGTAQAPGQSLTTPSGGSGWDQIRFRFYHNETGASYAIGTIYLLNQAYAGTPQDLSSATVGYIAEASGDGSSYTFAPTLVLEPDTQYFIFADLELSSGSTTHVSSESGGTFSGGGSYGAANGNGNFTARPFDIAFSLEGMTVIPEPEVAFLALLGSLTLGLRRREKS